VKKAEKDQKNQKKDVQSVKEKADKSMKANKKEDRKQAKAEKKDNKTELTGNQVMKAPEPKNCKKDSKLCQNARKDNDKKSLKNAAGEDKLKVKNATVAKIDERK